jgi:hypothetical protein
MATSGRGTGMMGNNVQTTVDAKHHPCGTLKAWMGATRRDSSLSIEELSVALQQILR